MNKSETTSSESDENSEESSNSDSTSSSASSTSSDSDTPSQEPEFSVQKNSRSQGLKLYLAYHRQSGDGFVSDNEADLSPAHGASMSPAQKGVTNIVVASVSEKSTPPEHIQSSADCTSGFFLSERPKTSDYKGSVQPDMSRTVPAKGLDRPRPTPGAPEPQTFEDRNSAVPSTVEKTFPDQVKTGDDGPAADKCVASISDTDSTQKSVSQVSEKDSPACASTEPEPPVDKLESERASVTSATGYTSTEEDSEDNRLQHKRPLVPQSHQNAATGIVDPPESLLRLDSMSLPNVSPDSGIQSIAGSPSDDAGSNTNRSGEMVAVEGNSRHHGGETESTASDGAGTNLGKAGIDSEMAEIPSPFKGPPSGRRKRGRPPKSKKAQFLQHKKSTLYSGLYTSASDSATVASSSVSEQKHDKAGDGDSQVLPESNGCEPQEDISSGGAAKCSESHKDSCAVVATSEESMATDPSDSKDMGAQGGKKEPGVKKRGPGRPKGNRRHKKNFFTYIKNRHQKLKNQSQGSTSESVVRHTDHENVERRRVGRPQTNSGASATSQSSTGEPVVKRKRGRPRKNPLPGEAAPPPPKPKPTVGQRGYAGHTLKRGRRPLEWAGNWSPSVKRNKQLSTEKKVGGGGDSEFASLIQSIQASINNQFQGGDVDETSEFAMDTNTDIRLIEPSLPSTSAKDHTKSSQKTSKPTQKMAAKPKKPKLHVMMRKTKRRKRKRLQAKPSPVEVLPASLSPSKSPSSAYSTSSFKDLSQQQSTTSLFGASPSRSLGFFRYRPSKILKQSSFSLNSSALGSVLNRQRDDSSESSMEGMTISEKTYIRVKPGEVPLPSIFKLTIIDVKKKKKDRLVLEPPVVLDKAKKVKARKDSKEREPAMPELVKEKAKAVRKKSQSDDNHPPSLEIQVARDQCLPPKKRHRMMFAAETTGAPAATQSEAHPPEKRRPGRPRKHPLPDAGGNSDKSAPGETKDGTKSRDASATPVSSPTRPAQKGQKQRHRSVESASGKDKGDDSQSSLPRLSSSSKGQPKTPVLTCPRHASYKSASELASCAECTLLAHSQPQISPSSQSSKQSMRDSSPAARLSKTRNVLKKHKVKESRTPSKNSCNSSGNTVDAGRGAISPKSRTKLAAASLPSAEVVIDPLPKSTLTAVIQSLSARKDLCNTSTSDFSDSGADDESVIRNVCSESEPLPVEHCRKRKISPVESDTTPKSKKRLKDSSQNSEDDASVAEDARSSGLSAGASSGAARRSSHDSQPPRKRYQRVGLFSDFYKDDEPKKRSENMLRNQGKTVLTKEETAAGLLPPPLHFGKHFREKTIDFQLPYDIWWLYSNDMLPKKQEPLPKFRRIRSNVYVDVKQSSRKFEPHPCNCKRPTESEEKGCQDDCLNRVVFTECTPETCPCEDRCSNQRIQQQQFAPALEKFLTEDRGFGVRTLEPIPAGHFILEYLGEVVSETEFRRRMTEEYSMERHHYCLNMDGRTVIDGYRMGNLTRFVNHACQPNCEMQKWNVNGLYRMVLLALRDIKPYEEISYDYNFHAFNLETQQECRCGSSQCRGVIGGKWQRSGQVGTHSLRSTRASTATPLLPVPSVGSHKQHNSKPPSSTTGSVTRALEKKQQVSDGGMNRLLSNSMKPMSQRERTYARRHSIFLVRNIDRARQGRQQTEEPGQDKVSEQTSQQATFEKVPDVLSMKEVHDRSVKTRLVALAEENPELQRRHRLAVIFNKIYSAVASFRDEDGNILATRLMVLPSRKRYADYYRIITDPIDLTTIRNNIKRGHYTDLQTIEADFLRLFKNVETYCGKKSEMGKLIARLRRVYQSAKADVVPQLEEVIGDGVALSTTSSEVDSTEAMETKAVDQEEEEEEEVIRCICGVYRDEGLMIQCEKCFIWQHCDCVQVSGEVEHYLCEICDPRPYDREIKLVPQPDDAEEDCEYYMTLLRDDLLVAIGDCVYLVRDCKHSKDGTPVRSSLRLVSSTSPDKMDIFRIEELYKNKKGERFAMGTPYVRPQETFHEPTRKFFPNEVFRMPTYEIVPLELVAGKCVVMDLNTYCKGQPKGFRSQDLYVCEYRVDKTAHLFHKIVKQRYPINTKSYCFEKYENRLCPKRTFSPHEVPEEYKKRLPEQGSSKSACKADEDGKKVADGMKDQNRMRTTEEKKQAKKERLNKLVTKMMATIPGKQKVDLSYLLDGTLGKRPRKKPTPSFS
ncbi:hypothetical protein BaRGS_00021943 [Batillaria attramentaria]|uniref:Histone-lysine N-methyltransferase n=1 Tax=Batillaria attramentaria TaxID=370345 RepID=A0ABD0KI76_9CAEN